MTITTRHWQVRNRSPVAGPWFDGSWTYPPSGGEVTPGDRWCLCAIRRLEAVEAGDPSPVILASTHERTLELVPLAILQQYAAG